MPPSRAGGTGRTRTGSQQPFSRYTVIVAKALPAELLSRMTAGHGFPVGCLCLLSAKGKLGEKSSGNWLIAMEGGAGFEPAAHPPVLSGAHPHVLPARSAATDGGDLSQTFGIM